MVDTLDRRVPKRRTQAERTEESGQRMLEAGIKLIMEHGPQKMTLKEVGELAGYSRGLASYRFGSKEGLLQEILMVGRLHWASELQRFVGDKQGLEALLASLDAFKAFLCHASDHYRVMLILWYESIGHPSPLTSKLKTHQAAQRRDVRRWVEQDIAAGNATPGLDAEQFAAAFCALVYGTAYQWQVNPNSFDIESLFAEHSRWLIRALRPE